MIVYGIKNCNTVKSALAWLNDHKVEFQFHDFKTKGISQAKLKAWAQQVGWETLVNRKGTTWRQLDDDTKEGITSSAAAIKLMADKTSVIKRPVVEVNDKIVTVGFDEEEYEKKMRAG